MISKQLWGGIHGPRVWFTGGESVPPCEWRATVASAPMRPDNPPVECRKPSSLNPITMGVQMKRLLIALLAATLGLASPVFAADKEPKSADKPAAAQAESKAPLDINRATAEELMTLKGIGDARAKAIIKGRPYARKDELVQKKIVPQSVYDDIKDQIIAKQK
jgi:competence protein ComEA